MLKPIHIFKILSRIPFLLNKLFFSLFQLQQTSGQFHIQVIGPLQFSLVMLSYVLSMAQLFSSLLHQIFIYQRNSAFLVLKVLHVFVDFLTPLGLWNKLNSIVQINMRKVILLCINICINSCLAEKLCCVNSCCTTVTHEYLEIGPF